MNCITIKGELVTPKTEAMAYEQTNQRVDTLEQSIQNDFAGVRQEIAETANEVEDRIGNEMEILNGRLTSDISSVDGRIDNIIAHNNDTEGNSELIDIRTGADGTVYTSAGAAVRVQVADINSVLDSGFESEVINRSRNLFDQTAITASSVISSDNPGAVVSNSNYFTTDFIPVDSVDHPNLLSTFAFVPSDTAEPTERRARKWVRIAGYDSSRQYVANTLSEQQSSYTVTDSTVKYVRISYNNTYPVDRPALLCQIMVEYGTDVISDLSHYDTYYAGDLNVHLKENAMPKNTAVRKNVYITASDGITEFFNKMTYAYNTGNCDVHIGKGNYVYTNSLIESIRNNSKRGIPIGNGCRYYFDTGAYLYCEYTGTQSGVTGMFSPLDSMEIGSDYEIYNLNLVAKNVLYAVHDEANASETPCRHIYKNCNLELDNTALGENSDPISKALGGGLGKYEEVIIENCVFKATNPNHAGSNQDDASYHGANRSTFTDAKLVIAGCYFENRFRTSNMNTQLTDEKHPQIIFTNNCSGAAHNIPNDWTSYVWNNNVR